MRKLLLVAFLAAACGKGSGPVSKDNGTGSQPASGMDQPRTGGSVDLPGEGATFPAPLYAKWIAEYAKVTPGVAINYQSIGSGGGIKQITEKTVDFGASDAPMKDEELAKAPGKLIHF